MKVTVNGDALSAAVSAVGGYAAGAGTRELSCLLLDAGDGLSVCATDLRGYGRFGAEALVEEPGRALVPYKVLSAIARDLPGGAVAVEAAGGECSVSCGGASYEVPSPDPGRFPEPPAVGAGEEVVVPAEVLWDAASRASRAAAKPGNSVLEGVRVESSGGRLLVVATDAYKLCAVEVGCGAGALSATVRPGMLARLKGMSGDASVASDGRRIRLSCGSAAFVEPLIGGRYPEWRRLLGGEPAAVCRVGLAGLSAAVGRAAAVAGANPVALSCDGSELAVSVVPRDGDGTRFRESVGCEGGAFEIAVGAAHLAPMLASLDGDAAELSFSGALEPLVARGGAATAVVMPVRA